jgi:hypothetical protein
MWQLFSALSMGNGIRQSKNEQAVDGTKKHTLRLLFRAGCAYIIAQGV